MSNRLVSRAVRLSMQARHRVARRLARLHDDGFILLESVIAITLITFIMGAIGVEYVNGLATTSRQRATQQATVLADSAVEQVRALNPTDLVKNHDTTSVNTQFAAANSVVQPWLTSMTKAIDSSAASGAGATAAIPTVGVTQKPSAQSYTVNYYLGNCGLQTSGGATSCVLPSQADPGAPAYIRAVIAVTWKSSTCPTTGCTYVTATLVSATADPSFKVNQPLPAAPIISPPGNQTSAINDVVSLQLSLAGGTGVPNFTWVITAGALPSGLGLNPAGLISGTPTGPTVSNQNVTVQVTDGYGRTATAQFTWSIIPQLVPTTPGPQASTTVTAVNLALSVTGGAGAPYTWTDPTGSLPAGLTVNGSGSSWKVSGTPTQVGVFPVSLTVADSSGSRTKTISFMWTVSYPPLAASTPGDQVATINTAVNPTIQLSASGGSGHYTWSDSPTSLPAGITISSSGLISGTPTALVTSKAVLITVTDSTAGYTKQVSFNFSVVAKPTISTPDAQTDSIGGVPNLTVSSSCPNSPCSYTLNNGPTGVSINASGQSAGAVGGSATTYNGVTVTMKDADGASVTSGSFSWTVYAKPTITTPGTQTDTLGGSSRTTVTSTCANAPCSYTINNGPSGLSMNSSGAAVGTVGGTARTYSNVTITITDADGVSVNSGSFSWVIVAAPSLGSLPAANTPFGESSAPSYAVTYSCPDAPCTITLANTVPGIGLSAGQVMATSNAATSLNVSATSGTVYLNGLVSTTAVTSGTSANYTPQLTIKDADNVAPAASSVTVIAYASNNFTVAPPDGISTSRNASPQQQLAYACPTSSCTLTISGAPSGIGLDTNTSGSTSTSLTLSAGTGSIYVRGTVSGSAAKTTYVVTLTLTQGGRTLLSLGNWVVS